MSFFDKLKDEIKFQAANIGAGYAVQGASTVPYSLYTKFGKDESTLVNKLMQDAYNKKLVDTNRVNIVSDIGKNEAYFVPRGTVRAEGRKLVNTLGKDIIAGPAAANKAGVIAHEIGHAQSMGKELTDAFNKTKNVDKAIKATGRLQLGPKGVGLAGLINALGHRHMSDTAMNTVAGIGAATMLPRLAEETKASWNGYKLLRNAGKGRLGALTAFAGVPSYLALTASPFIPAFLSKKMDKKAAEMNYGMDKSAGIKEALLELALKAGDSGKDVAMKLLGRGKNAAKKIGTSIANSKLNTPEVKWIGLPTVLGAGIGGVKNWNDDESVLKGLLGGGLIGGATGFGALNGTTFVRNDALMRTFKSKELLKYNRKVQAEYFSKVKDEIRAFAKKNGITGKLPKGFFNDRRNVFNFDHSIDTFISMPKGIAPQGTRSKPMGTNLDYNLVKLLLARAEIRKANKALRSAMKDYKNAPITGGLIGGGLLGGLGTLLTRPFTKDKK